MIRKIPFILILLLFSFLAVKGLSQEINVNIRFFDKKIYYLSQTNIDIKLTLTNNTGETFRFKVAANKYFNLDFDVLTPSNLSLSHAEEFIIERNSNQPVFFKELSLEPGEEYGFVVELKDFITFKEPGVFSVQARFFPELYKGKNSIYMGSNRLTLDVRPPAVLKEMETVIEAESGKTLEKQVLPPDEVVRYMINARQRSQWDKFFLYLDLEGLILNNPERSVKYKKKSAIDREKMIEDFKKELRKERVDEEINVIPSSFVVQKTSYTANKAQVSVLEKFKYRDYTETKQYIYHLERRDQYWLIVNYEIHNRGTE
ncbi:MAG: hypothetical protein JW969_07380 [Spirochaetales bacterium]|nr:hypothetical protein [Spirochaetales bacterium]